MRKLNNKGYMLVEIILAFSITFILVYFLMDLVINLKNKNDDILVESIMKTDQTIITNKLMEYVIAEEKNFDCELLKNGITEGSIIYKGDMLGSVSENSFIDKNSVECNSNDLGKVSIKIPILVRQINDKNFDVLIDYKYDIGDMIAPSCSLSVSGTSITASFADNEGGSGVDYDLVKTSNFDWTFVENGVSIISVDRNGDYLFTVMDKAGNSNLCSLNVEETYSKNCNCRKVAIGMEPCGRDCSSCPPDDNGSHGWVCGCETKYCNVYDDVCDTCYNCNFGYTKINDNYCYKIN